jgi:hypothetical protein
MKSATAGCVAGTNEFPKMRCSLWLTTFCSRHVTQSLVNHSESATCEEGNRRTWTGIYISHRLVPANEEDEERREKNLKYQEERVTYSAANNEFHMSHQSKIGWRIVELVLTEMNKTR